ncbi:uncharacterized protein LOC111001074 [Pieris rapae]|uniref:uncharacterized protein LOC111001074 n=1 Tax=Pieris rapae TaxID=64459 RepID=UPI001E27E9BD|nr:uncharacterized protein LOC111001074 [Pieris rapae]
MRNPVLLLTLLIAARAFPTKDIPELNALEKSDIERIEKDIRTISYIQNFKTIMSDYVKTQYNNLTVTDMEVVKETLEVFLHNFAADLHNVIDKGEKETVEEINDGIPNSTFDDVKKCIKNELPDVNEEMAEQVVYKLRKNLLKTRNVIDDVIRKSQVNEELNSGP